ncbi:MAG: alpha/beta hydrolase [Firmicutes bacterium]|nr:alpha/beta hydrolase [Bacillota bacterium]
MRKSTECRTISYLLLAVLIAACTAFAWGCTDAKDGSAPAKSPDLTRYDNGYGTYFVTGTRIAHEADKSSSIAADWSDSPEARSPAGFEVTEEKGIVYSHTAVTDGKDKGQPLDLRMNLMYAKAGQDSAQADGEGDRPDLRPVILLIPGGGFVTCRIDNKYTNVQKYLAAHGYAVAIMEYHVIGQGRYMDAAADVRSAVEWLREHGAEHGLDKDRIALMGNSAGGYVAALAACEDGSDIRCVVNFYGLSDLVNNKADYEEAAIQAHHKPESTDSQFVNGVESGKALTDDLQEAAKADPAFYIDGKEPPFLHLHGDADLLVSPSQSVHLHEALLAEGVSSTRYTVAGAGHGDAAFRTEAALDIVIGFLDQYCR